MKGKIKFIRSEFYLRHDNINYVMRFKNNESDNTIMYAIFIDGNNKCILSGKYKFKKSAHKTDAINLLKEYLNDK